MEDNQLVLAFRQLIKLIIDADKDLANSISSETVAREADVRDLISKITAEEQSRTSADEALDERILNLVTALNTEITERQTAISNLETALNEESTTRSEEDQKLLELINAQVTALVNEAKKRKESDDALSARINSEATARSTADSELTEAISNEAKPGTGYLLHSPKRTEVSPHQQSV